MLSFVLTFGALIEAQGSDLGVMRRHGSKTEAESVNRAGAAESITTHSEGVSAEGKETSLAKRSRLESLEATVLESLTSGAVTPGMRLFLDTIRNLTEHQMKPKVVQEHEKDQQAMDNLRSSFDTCSIGPPSTNASVKRGDAENKTRIHKKCRLAEIELHRNFTECLEDRSSDLEVVDSLCNISTNFNETVCEMLPGQSYDMYLTSMYQEFKTRRNEYMARVQRCRWARQNATNCSTYNQSWIQQKYECDILQVEMDEAHCLWAAAESSGCRGYRICYEGASANWDEKIQLVRSLEADRKKEWELLSSITCLVDSRVGESGKLNSTQLDACKTLAHNTSHLNIRYPVKPGPLPCNETNSSVPTPCSNTYLDLRYHIPEFVNLTLRQCTECA